MDVVGVDFVPGVIAGVAKVVRNRTGHLTLSVLSAVKGHPPKPRRGEVNFN